MEATSAKSPGKRGLNAHGRAVRRERIFAWMRDGWAYDEIAREEGVTAERIRQIVTETLQKRRAADGVDHVKLQLARVEKVMRFASEALARGEFKVGSLYLKALDRLDRYQKVAAATDGYTDADRQKLIDKLNRVAERLGYDKIIAENDKIIAEYEATRPLHPGEQRAAPASSVPE